MSPANPMRGEAEIRVAGELRVLRPSFTRLIAAEEELGPLFALVDRTADGKLRLDEMTALFWHCLEDRAGLSREDMGRAIVEAGLAAMAAPLRVLLTQILQGRPATEAE